MIAAQWLQRTAARHHANSKSLLSLSEEGTAGAELHTRSAACCSTLLQQRPLSKEPSTLVPPPQCVVYSSPEEKRCVTVAKQLLREGLQERKGAVIRHKTRAQLTWCVCWCLQPLLQLLRQRLGWPGHQGSQVLGAGACRAGRLQCPVKVDEQQQGFVRASAGQVLHTTPVTTQTQHTRARVGRGLQTHLPSRHGKHHLEQAFSKGPAERHCSSWPRGALACQPTPCWVPSNC